MKLILKETSQIGDVVLIATINQWILQQEISATPQQPRQIIWSTQEDNTVIKYVEDTLLNHRYIIIQGLGEEIVSNQVMAGLEVVSLSELDQLLDPDLDTSTAILLVNAVALSAPEKYDPKIFELFTHALRHPVLDVRRAALFGVTYVPWEQFRQFLINLLKEDLEISIPIQTIIKSIDQYGWH